MSPDILLLANLAATLFLTGLMWYLQVVHLPMFRRMDEPGFHAYAREQRMRNTTLMTLPMLVEVVTLAWLRGPLLVTAWPLAIVWAVTFGLHIPRYGRLMRAYSEPAVQSLIRINWIRTICWTTRAGMMLWIADEHLHI